MTTKTQTRRDPSPLTFFAALAGGMALFIGVPVALSQYDKQDTETTYRVGHMFGGGMGVIENVKGKRIGIYNDENVVGLYSYGEPRVIGFDCGEYGKTLIAMEEDLLPECGRVEAITYDDRKADWAN